MNIFTVTADVDSKGSINCSFTAPPEFIAHILSDGADGVPDFKDGLVECIAEAFDDWLEIVKGQTHLKVAE
jgi:hypothetical protein